MEISELKDILEKKDEEIANLAKFRDDLNSELEETKGKMSELEHKANQLDRLNSEVYDLKKTVTLKNDELNKLNVELDDLKNQIAKLNDIIKEKEKAFDEQKIKLEKAETELSALKPTEPTEYTSEERLICPKCGARGRDLKVEEDKSKVLSYVGHSPLYSHINVCKKCGYKF
ncbi:MAG: hypothetical protein JSV23_07580 [Promethearchaeota archaeon]|nr:MAG: hypothetical protein JSV23_07580 [Candidatus Lokiarchaeota archaeon]